MTDRRQFLVGTAACLASATLMPGLARAARQFDPQPGEWRTFRVVTRLEIPADKGAVQAWVPLASVNDEWMQPLGEKWTGNAVSATIVTDPASGTKLLHATFAEGGSPAVLEVENTIKMRDRSVTGTEPSGNHSLSDGERQLYLAATDLVPTDGIVKQTAEEITKGLDRMKQVFVDYEAEEEFDEDELVQRLVELRESLRQHFRVGRTLQEQLADAIANEARDIFRQLDAVQGAPREIKQLRQVS